MWIVALSGKHSWCVGASIRFPKVHAIQEGRNRAFPGSGDGSILGVSASWIKKDNVNSSVVKHE